ncbi:peroxide stress protein YaaA [Massilia sp. LXY-6]|uniref:peroxide stress protein YaaA n=1 Tax=Massilia sp. LXY-6 TaxID=3379823 RepID=UPI003EE21AAC
MLIVLSPAKSLDLDTPPTTDRHTTPQFIDRAAELIRVLKEYSPAQVGALMSISDPLAVLNVTRYASWHPDHLEARQAVMSFDGDVYTGLDARSLAPQALAYLQDHVRILSGLYGVLRPLDRMHPYRLEMGTKLANPRGKDLYAFWGETVTGALNEALVANGADALVNLASEEYFRSVKPKLLDVPVIVPVFEDWKNGKYKIISFFAKRARGMMARYAAERGITDPQRLKEFDVDGYAFDAGVSTEKEWVFRRRVEAG